ncbi:MAG: redoxin domain-containing protein [Bacteroidales bacterium]|nr:redoxin domain-containing protein [Bacteroidales bacterium]
MRKLLFCSFLFLLPIILLAQQKKGYEISVSIRGLSDSTIFLAYHFGDKQYLQDTIKLDRSGSGIFSGDEELPHGIYMIVLPGKQYFEILATSDQSFQVSCSFPDYFNTLKFAGCDENARFLSYQKRWIEMQKNASGLNKRMQGNKQNPDSLRILSSKLKLQEESMKSYLNSVVTENKGNLLSLLVRSMLPVEVPEIRIPFGANNPDSLRWVKSYMYNKNHFFDNVSLTDERLLRTPILHTRLKTYFSNVVIQAPDSINKEIDRILATVKGNSKIYQYIAVFLFNHFRESEIMGHDAVLVKLADDVYLSGKADWVTKEFRDNLKKEVDMIRPNLIGQKGRDLVMDSYRGIHVSLYDIEKEFTILYFWEPDCGHCKEATPKLKAYYDKNKDKSIEIFAVCTTAEKEKWKKYIEDNDLNWINGWDPDRKTNYDYYYNVRSTPMIYILDRNKKIIAKKLDIDDIGSFIDNYRKYFSK